MPSAYALGIVSRNSILDFGVADRRRAFRYSFFTGGVVMENGRCSAASYGSAALTVGVLAPPGELSRSD